MLFKNHKKNCLSLLACLLFLACKKDLEIAPSIPKPENCETVIQASLDHTQLNERLAEVNRTLLWQLDDPNNQNVSSQKNLIWKYPADLKPLYYQGETLIATHIEIVFGYAIIGYKAGIDNNMGAIEVVDIFDKKNIKVTSLVVLECEDVDGFSIAPTSTRSLINISAVLTDAKQGGSLVEFAISGGLIQDFSKRTYFSEYDDSIASSTSKSVIHAGDYLYASSGIESGAVYEFNHISKEYQGKFPLRNTEFLNSNGHENAISDIVILETGQNAALRWSKIGQVGFDNNMPIAPILFPLNLSSFRGNNGLQFHPEFENHVYVAMGNNGVQVFDINNSSNLYQSPGNFLINGISNGLCFHEDRFYVANGKDGLAIFSTPEEVNESPAWIYNWEVEEIDGSYNFAEANDEWLFVAKEEGGVKILRKPLNNEFQIMSDYDEDGVPIDLAPDEEICETLLNSIFDVALPSGQDATVAHPEYFSDQILREIHIEEEAEVFMTFLHEGASFLNSLGYYTYNADNPPSSSDELNKTLIFPNASAQGSGGNLQPGNTILLLGTFEANTVVGFFLVADGWRDGDFTNGLDIHYTFPPFNKNGDTQSIIFHDTSCDATVICFEDINANSGSDRDFNDAIFQIRSEPEGAIYKDDYLKL